MTKFEKYEALAKAASKAFEHYQRNGKTKEDREAFLKSAKVADDYGIRHGFQD